MTDLDESATAAIREVVSMAEIGDFFDRSFSELAAVLERQGIAPAGPAFACYTGPPGETADVEVGFPIQQPVEPDGPRRRLRATRRVMGAPGCLDRGTGPHTRICPVGDHTTEPSPDMDPAALRTELFWTIQ